MIKKIIFPLLAVILFGYASSAQYTYLEMKFSKEIFKHLELGISPQVRFKENFKTDKYFADLSAEYKFCKYLSTEVTYRLGADIDKNNKKEFFWRFAIDAKSSFKWYRFEPGIRVRYSNENEDFSDGEDDNINYLRYKFGLKYHIKEVNLSPYVCGELFQELSESKLDKFRYESGLLYKINKHNKIGAYYRVNITAGAPVNIVGLTYKLKL